MSVIRRGVAGTVLAASVICCPSIAMADEGGGQKVRYDFPPQSLSDALLKVGEATKRQIIFPGEVMARLKAPEVHGLYSADEVVRLLLAGTRFKVEFSREAIYISGRSEAAPTPLTENDVTSDITVTGSRIRGAITSSPVFRYETKQLRDEGVTDMRSLAAVIPQNFTGGQNPGVGTGGEGRGNSNGNSSTSLNLRGLGSDATLTLMNGHRLAYNQNSNSVDFSSIPFAAVARVEVMPDGASAIYGSDAVGGVANIILKDSFEGLWANAIIGAATEGGYITQSYNAVTGQNWGSGGLMITGNYDRSTGILAGERPFTSTVNPAISLFPLLKAFGFVAVAHQDLSQKLTLSVDALYSERDAYNQYAYTLTGPVTQSGLYRHSSNWSLNVAPKLNYTAGEWNLFIQGVYGKTGVTTVSRLYPSGSSTVRMKNDTIGVEVGAEGRLLALPAGFIRAAVGGGYRKDSLHSQSAARKVGGDQESHFAYGELGVPIVGPAMSIPGVYRLNFDAALRYEDYRGVGSVVTPKLGVNWSPTPDFDLKGSWGRSFKAPTLYQRLVFPELTLFPGDLWGERSAPAGQTILQIDGGNADLKPERASNLSATVVLHPRSLTGFSVSATYFKVNYRDRIAMPAVAVSRMLTDPVYAGFVSLNPTSAGIEQLLSQAPAGILDVTGTGQPFDPASVFAIVDYRYTNVSRDRAEGVDVSGSYSLDFTPHSKVTLQVSATYLSSQRVVVDGLAAVEMAGTIYYPPHVRVRGGVSIDRGPLSVNAIVNHIGGVKDNRLAAQVNVDGMTTFDLTLKRRFGDDRSVEAQISAANLFNARPDHIRATGINLPYDSANYSPIGRYISFSITKAM
ncbi:MULTISPECIES: TonB-dependent receptor plug domain-containing protein [unclassified Novosphingobium]|nr:TonB-dependent receptor [Novosphingobium sp. ST904]TCM22471.1 outer membrane receptor for ferrienterochelin and colicin [Novosphingobium sp. ST904]